MKILDYDICYIKPLYTVILGKYTDKHWPYGVFKLSDHIQI